MLRPDAPPREPWAKGQYIVGLVKDRTFDDDTLREICDNCGVTVANIHKDRCLVTFDESEAESVKEKLEGWPEYIRSVSRNHYVYLQ